ncbi:hypothetical protein D187_007954 [Cystobacter fuscus DSM 2262]|uniref:Uncharacterized protein n=1 Tax=Cystobacter fuscus (strain ATCC 25194 / DSM 2262 / NBRC 100088 / M29) TaxID=1242864 RepID=S9P316_CYSF2|nr:hypothetical protein D187_007954 [Cystobacter fuscus DSM 2262]
MPRRLIHRQARTQRPPAWPLSFRGLPMLCSLNRAEGGFSGLARACPAPPLRLPGRTSGRS